jgi:hypothetical protein
LPETVKEIDGIFGSPVNIKGGKILITLNNNYLLSKPDAKLEDEYEFEFLSKKSF